MQDVQGQRYVYVGTDVRNDGGRYGQLAVILPGQQSSRLFYPGGSPWRPDSARLGRLPGTVWLQRGRINPFFSLER